MMPHYKALARAGGRRKNQLLRLCRPMCGKALPFRYVLLLFLEAMPPIPEAQPRERVKKPNGKAESFRTSNGIAGKKGLAGKPEVERYSYQ
jgi:hypothetical protein